eukprot:3750920-Pyramimonas_sp.AAC.1
MCIRDSIDAAVRDHPLRTLSGVEKVPSPTLARRGRGERPPPAHPLWYRGSAVRRRGGARWDAGATRQGRKP